VKPVGHPYVLNTGTYMKRYVPVTEFGADYLKDEHGWILFPTYDVQRRRDLFPQEVFAHPAKANIFLMEEIIEYTTQPGDTILDPFGGTGTTMIAALSGRNVTTIEIEQGYLELQQRIHSEWLDTPDLAEGLGNIRQLQGDCRLVLPVPCDHIVFSPPYGNALGKSTGLDKDVAKGQEAFTEWGKYSQASNNLGNLNPFLFAQAMKKVYAGLAASVPPGGSMVVITKDIMRNQKRVHLSQDCIKTCSDVGFTLTEWHKWKTSGSAQAKIMRSKGAEVVWDEDILVFRRN